MGTEIDKAVFGRRVRERRIEIGYKSQAKFVKASGYSQSNLSWIELGKSKEPRKQVIKLAEALRTTTDWLLYGKGPKEVGPRVMSRDEWNQAYSQLAAEDLEYLSDAVATAISNLKEQKKRALER